MSGDISDTTRPDSKVLLWGGRSKARIIAEMLRESGLGQVALVFDSSLDELNFEIPGLFTNDICVLKKNIHKVSHYVVCVGGANGFARFMTSRYLERLGLKSLSLIHGRSFIEPTAKLGAGCQVMPFAVVHKFVEIGEHAIINTNSTVDHECVIGNGVHIMGSAAVAGKVEIGDYATIGTNSTIFPYVKIGEGAFVGAGALVNKDVPPYSVVFGVPAKVVRNNILDFHEDLLIALTS